jgi:hypothetical protein
MAQSPFEALVSGIKTGREVGTEIAQSNILQEVYKGTTPEAMTPDMQQAALTKASVLAGQKGLGSLQHIFQKEAGEVATANQESKLNEIKLAKTNLGYASQLAQGAKDPSDLLSAVDAVPNLATNEKMILRSIANDPRMPFEQKQKMFVKMGQTALQNAEAEYKLAVGEARLEDADTRKLDVIRKEKAAANKASNIKPAKEATQGAIKRQTSSLQAELGDIQTPDAQGNLKPLSSAQLSSVASRIENEGRQRYKNNPGDYSSVQEAVDEARDDIIAKDFPTTKTKKTIFGVGIPGTSEEERVYKPAGKQTAKPAEKKAATKTQKMPDAATLKDYADQHFGGNTKKAKEFLKSKGYSD